MIHQVDVLEEIVVKESPELISSVRFARGITWLQISNIRLKDTGLVWGYITPKFADNKIANDSAPPSSIQIKFMANNLD